MITAHQMLTNLYNAIRQHEEAVARYHGAKGFISWPCPECDAVEQAYQQYQTAIDITELFLSNNVDKHL